MMNDLMSPCKVLKYIPRASMRTIYFVWEVTFRLIINPNRLYCSAVWCWILFLNQSLTHKQDGEGCLLQWKAFDWTVTLVKSQRKAESCSLRVCIWERQFLFRWNVWFSSSVTGESGWDLKWNHSCISATEVFSQVLQRGEGSAALKVQSPFWSVPTEGCDGQLTGMQLSL